MHLHLMMMWTLMIIRALGFLDWLMFKLLLFCHLYMNKFVLSFCQLSGLCMVRYMYFDVLVVIICIYNDTIHI